MLVGMLANLLPMGPADHPSPDVQFFGSVPVTLTPVLSMLSTIPGAIGGLFGRGLSASASQPG
jgi:hypothetical protein